MRGTVASLLRGIDRYAFYKINYLRIFAGIYQRYEAKSVAGFDRFLVCYRGPLCLQPKCGLSVFVLC